MLKIGEYVTTVEKKLYPWIGTIEDIMPNGMAATCLFFDPDGSSRKVYNLSGLRHYSAKEMADDIFAYFNKEEPSIEKIYSGEYLKYLQNEIWEQKAAIKAIHNAPRSISDPDYDGYTSAELAEIEYREEFTGMLNELYVRIYKGIAHTLSGFNWDELSEAQFENLKTAIYNGIEGEAAIVRIGTICINVITKVYDDECGYCLDYDFYVGGEDTRYGYKSAYPNVNISQDNRYPYSYADGASFSKKVLDMSYAAFKKYAEKLFIEYIMEHNDQGSYSLIAHAKEPLLKW